MLSPHQIIKQVAKLVNQNNTCFINRKNRKIVTITVDYEGPLNSELSIEKCIIVPPMSKQDLGFAMKDFLQEVTDSSVKKELAYALRRKNPQRNFMQVIESRIDISQHWRRFKSQQCEEYVRQIFIDEYNH